MSQTTTLRAMDAAIVGAMLDGGFADAAVYTPPGGGASIACSILVDRAVAFFGQDDAEVAGYRDTITCFAAEVPTPQRGGTFTVGPDVFTLDELDARDESMQRWVVVS